ncbi:MAG: hypothetical protein AAGJ83_10165 [Planctomycetota bacterium]
MPPNDASFPTRADIDTRIQWLAQQRAKAPDAVLGDLLPNELEPSVVVELACIDLIEQRRRGLDVRVEHLLEQFPCLAERRAFVLDLADAELCVRRELGETASVEFFATRFPRLRTEIAQLVHLDGTSNSLLPESDASVDQEAIAPPSRVDLRLGLPTRNSQEDSVEAPIPIPPPTWMTAARCIATEVGELGRTWLVTGHDTERDESVAMKVIPVPATIGKRERTQMLDLCELASNVVHPSWATPRIAAINNGHLAVIRPWIFGTSLHARLPTPENLAHDRSSLVKVAFCVAAAHRVGATHGSISSRNLMVDYQSDPHLVDCVASGTGWLQYFSFWLPDLMESAGQRRQLDIVSLKQLIGRVAIRTDEADAETQGWCEWFSGRIAPIDSIDPSAAAQVGECLQEALDRGPREAAARRSRRWWRS